MEDYRTWQKFDESQSVEELTQILAENQIVFEIEDASQRFDVAFAHNGRQKEYRIKLREADFERANELMERIVADRLDEVEPDYYLLSFTSEELFEVLLKPDEWSAFDYMLAQKLLNDRGEGLSKEELDQLKAERLAELAQPEEKQTVWISVGYLSASLGGILGIIIGAHLQKHMKTLPNGERVHAYSESDVWHGKVITIIGSIVLFGWLAYRVLFRPWE